MQPHPDNARSPSRHVTPEGQTFWMWRDAEGRDFVQFGEDLKWNYHSTQEQQKNTESDAPF